MIGKAAHISGAAAGKGSRRYDPSMSPEERKSITNAVWLCAYHADVIDRDEVTYTIQKLRAMKAEHEVRKGEMVRSGHGHDLGAGLLAGSPGRLLRRHSTGRGGEMDASPEDFFEGDVHAVVSFTDGFAGAAVPHRYILSNELGDGRVLSAAPTLIKQDGGYTLQCPIAPSFPRIRAQGIGSDLALHPETRDLYVDIKGDIARVSGIDRLPQHVEMALSLQQGESPFYPGLGIRFFEYFEAYRGSPWLSLLMMLDVIREASIPFADVLAKKQYTQLRCVKRVHGIELLSEVTTNHRLPVRVDFDVNGLGRWQRELSIYMPTREQMERQAEVAG